MKTNDEHATMVSLSKELVDFLLALCWVLEKHFDKITGQKGSKMRICFCPLTESIGFEKKPKHLSYQRCEIPVLVYLIRFLMGYVVPGKDEYDLEMRERFFEGISPNLASKLLECMKGEDLFFLNTYVLDLVGKKISQNMFYRGETPEKGEKFWYVNSFYIMRIKEYLQKEGCSEWVYQIARLVYSGHLGLADFNPSLGLGLKVVPCIQRSNQ